MKTSFLWLKPRHYYSFDESNAFRSFQSEEDVPFAGENFVRHTGESTEFAKAQVFAWDAMDKGVDVHPQANPTQLAVLRKSYKAKKVREIFCNGGFFHYEQLVYKNNLFGEFLYVKQNSCNLCNFCNVALCEFCPEGFRRQKGFHNKLILKHLYDYINFRVKK